MLRVIFDTNIYGKLIEEERIEEISLKIKQDKNFIVYGFKPVRKELRKTPKTIKLGTLSKRNVLLNLYDNLTQGRELNDSFTIHELATSFREQFDALWNQDVIVHKGFERVTERFWSMLDELKKGEEYQVLGATYGQGGKKLQDWFARYHAERVKRGIPARLLTVAKDYGVVVKEFMHAEDPNFENALKRLSPEFSSPMQINLYPNNKVLMFLFGKDMMCFEIDSSVVHTNFKNQFDALWNQETRVEKGLDAVQNIFEEILASGHADFIGARGYFIDYRQEFMKEWEKRAKKRGFTMRNLVDKESKGHTITQFPFAETKYTLSKEFSTLSVFWIYGNKVVISNWMDKDNPIVVIIENKRIHDMYKQQFELLWKK